MQKILKQINLTFYNIYCWFSGFDKDPEVDHVREISEKLVNFVIETDTELSSMPTDTGKTWNKRAKVYLFGPFDLVLWNVLFPEWEIIYCQTSSISCTKPNT